MSLIMCFEGSLTLFQWEFGQNLKPQRALGIRETFLMYCFNSEMQSILSFIRDLDNRMQLEAHLDEHFESKIVDKH